MHKLAILFMMVFMSCNCGTPEGRSCVNKDGCPSGYACASGVCTSGKGPDGGPVSGAGGGSVVTNPNAGGGSPTACVNLQCRQMACPAGQTTSISGKVYAPNGTLPLYNAVVFVPNQAVSAFTPGVSCDKCETTLTGAPVVQKLTDASGAFRLENVPTGDNVPLVIQIGRWRRQLVIPKVAACTDTPLPAEQTRLPKTKAEGDIPQMAIVTGKSDPFQCLLRKIGLSDGEFTTPSGAGRVHYFAFREGGSTFNGIPLATPTPDQKDLMSSLETIKKYDVVMLPCQGKEYPDDKPEAEKANLVSFANAGGRVFTTHYGYEWIRDNTPWKNTASWQQAMSRDNDFSYQLETTFAKGQAFATWLKNEGASANGTSLSIKESRTNVKAVDGTVGQRWLFDNAPSTTVHYTFNTPVAALLPDGGAPEQCGRVVFSDFHVSASALNTNTDNTSATFPSSCKNEPLNGQEKALAFMLFDLSSCVQRDEVPPDIN
jgi:hypothetical protein